MGGLGVHNRWSDQVEVMNASYGFLKDDHSYTVGVKDRGDVAIPAECDCPAAFIKITAASTRLRSPP